MLEKGLFSAGIRLYVHYEGLDAGGMVWHEWVTIGEVELVLKPGSRSDHLRLPVKDPLPLAELRRAIPSICAPTDIIGSTEYVLGGLKAHSSLVYPVDLEAGSCSIPLWRQLPSMLGARFHPFSAVAEGKLYVFGGALQVSPVAEVYDPQANAWTALEEPPEKNLARQVVAGACFYWAKAKKIVVSLRLCWGGCNLLMYDVIERAWSHTPAMLCPDCKWMYASPQYALPSDSDTLFIMGILEWHVFDLHSSHSLGPVVGLEEELKKLPGIQAVIGDFYRWPRMFLLGHDQHGLWEFDILWMGTGDMMDALYFAKILVKARSDGCFVGKVASLGGCRLLGPGACLPRRLLVHCEAQLPPCKRAAVSTQEQELANKLPKHI